MTQPLTWPFLIALAELRWLKETATHGNQLEWKHFLCILITALFKLGGTTTGGFIERHNMGTLLSGCQANRMPN
jgi:hypothetical protein